MCGVIGLLLRDPDLEPQLGSMLVSMIGALDERGPDSSGIARYTDHDASSADGAGPSMTWLSLGADVPVDWSAVIASVRRTCGPGIGAERFGPGLALDAPEHVLADVRSVLGGEWPEVRVLGAGQNLRVLKDTGPPAMTCERYGIEGWHGYLAVAHTRMATESAVTVLHSHPFVPAGDLCVAHNGSFSNYATMRRRLSAEGVSFDSDNDSEVAARFLATRLAAGDDLAEATRWVMKEMDGFFTLVIGSGEEMSVVRDAFACKPAVVAVAAGYVAAASEYRALAELPGVSDAEVFEPQPEEVYTWRR